jgi:hypothetical protein
MLRTHNERAAWPRLNGDMVAAADIIPSQLNRPTELNLCTSLRRLSAPFGPDHVRSSSSVSFRLEGPAGNPLEGGAH